MLRLNNSIFSKGINYMKSLTNKNNRKLNNKVLILHVHGGGFISMSSGSHQNYTRMWANILNIPIFSIDYRLAPKYPFPTALNDIWQTYYWFVEYGFAYLGIEP